MKKHILAGCIAAISIASNAQAQDWEGFYVGGHFGAADLSGDYTAFTPNNGFAGFLMSGLEGTGAIGGVQVGRNWNMGTYVLGIEGTLSAGGVEENSTVSSIGNVPVFSRDVDTLMTLSARVGMPVNGMLLYARAGVAGARFTSGHDQNSNWISNTETETGWLVGLGLEGQLAQNLTWRVDFTHMDFGDFRTDITGPGPAIWTQQDSRVQTLTVGLNYWFN